MSYFKIALDPWDEYKMKNKIFSKKKLRMDTINKIMKQNNRGVWSCINPTSTYELLQKIQREKNLSDEWRDTTYDKIKSHRTTKLFGTYSNPYDSSTDQWSPRMSNTQLTNFLTLIPE